MCGGRGLIIEEVLGKRGHLEVVVKVSSRRERKRLNIALSNLINKSF